MTPPCPLIAPKASHSVLQMRAVPTGTAVLCALIGTLWVRCSVTPDSFTPSDKTRTP
jgi:hypothetical protein